VQAHFAVGHFPGLVGFRRLPLAEPGKRTQHILSSTSAFLQSLQRLNLVCRIAEAIQQTPLMGFNLPSAHTSNEGPHVAGLPHPLGSAFRVWLPSWRVTPLGAWPGLFRPDSALGILPFGACILSKGGSRVSTATEPACRSSDHDLSYLRTDMSRCEGRRLPGFGPFKSPDTARNGLGCKRCGNSHGVPPFQGNPPSTLNGLITHSPLARFAECSSANCSNAAP
jgi:hypothetical protein